MNEEKNKLKSKILQTLAPCGLNCRKCFAFNEGEIKALSRRLEELLGNFDPYAERFSGFIPVFENYPSFKYLLHFLTKGDCSGCRRGNCKYPDCEVIKCYQNKEVDFCFQCSEFPCNKTNFDPDLKKRWLQMNNEMKSIGIEAFFEKSEKLPRYR